MWGEGGVLQKMMDDAEREGYVFITVTSNDKGFKIIKKVLY